MKKNLSPQEVMEDLRQKRITFRVGSEGSLAEEAPSSYKDVTEVVEICMSIYYFIPYLSRIGHQVGISKKAFRLEPVCVVKG